MKRLVLLLICLSFTLSFYSQNNSSTYTKTISLDPEDGNGMLGSVTMVYAFSNCFGDALMAYGYKNVYFSAVRYKGKDYTADELGLNNFDNYTTSFNVKANYYFGGGYVTTSNLTYILNSYDIGCYGQTNTISSKNKNHLTNLDNFSVNFEVPIFRITGSLAFKIDNYEKDKTRRKKLNSLLNQVDDNPDPEIRLLKLNEAMSFAKSDDEKENIQNLRNKANIEIKQKRLEEEREEELERLRKETEAEKERLKEQEMLQKENTEKKLKKKQRKESKNKLEQTRNNLVSSESKLLNQASSMRDQANSMVVQYRFQQDYKNKLLSDAKELEDYVESSRKTRQFATVGSDETGRQAAAVNSYNDRMSSANDKNNQLAAQSAAATASVLYILGGIIYDKYGSNDGSIYKENATNFHLGFDVGFSCTSAPVFFPSEFEKLDPNTEETFIEELNKPGQPVTLNLGGKLQLGVENNNYRVEAYGGFRAGISPILTGSNLQYFYGGQASLGIKNIKVLGGYELGQRNYTLSKWNDEQERGKGKSQVNTRNIRLGLEFSWYGNDKAYSRNHLSFGIMQEQITKLGDDNFFEYLPDGEVSVNDIVYNDNGQAGFYNEASLLDGFNDLDDYNFTGFFLEWRHDHHGTLLLEFFPKYAHTGEVKEFFNPDDWDDKGNFLFTISFTRNLDWFFN